MACTTTMPPMAGFGTLPNNTMSESEYCAALIDYYLKLGIFITDLEARSMWIQATAEAACTVATNAANSATTAQQQVVLAAAQVALAADQVDLAEQFADAAAISANDAQNSAITSQTWALESLESAGIAAALANLQFGGFYVLDGELYAEYNNLAISTPQIIDGEFIVEWI